MIPALTRPQLDRLRQVLNTAAGLAFDDSRAGSLAWSVGERCRQSGAPDASAYLELLEDPAELQRFLDEVTVQETHFFRNPPQVRALHRHVLPELLRHADRRGRRLRVWSAGCSTGEEAYSLAMALRELLPSTAGWDVQVLATDLSTRAVAAARLGIYGERAVALATPAQRARFFEPVEGGRYRVRDEVRDLVQVRQHNLVTEPPPVEGPVDLVLCRNVTIYFARDTTRALMGRLHGCLRDGGYLFLGHSETLWQVSEDFRLVTLGAGEDAAFVYRRLDPVPDAAAERRAVLPDRRTAGQARVPERRVTTRRPAPSEVARASGTDLVEAARQALLRGAYDEAARLAGQAVADDPLRAEVFYVRGLAMVEAGHDALAVVELRKAVYLDGSCGLAHFLLAGVLGRLGSPAAAAREYAAAAQTLGPSDAGAHELGGRSVAELAALCRDLAQREAG